MNVSKGLQLHCLVNWHHLEAKLPTRLANSITNPATPKLRADALMAATFETSFSSESLYTATPKQIKPSDAADVKAAMV